MARQYVHIIKGQVSTTADTIDSSMSSYDSSNLINTTASDTASCSSKTSSECFLWKTKKPTQLDHEATLAFLGLRKQFDKEFADKKTSKNAVWQKIATKMNEMGFYVGDGVEGRERLRQKFANMTATYLKTIQKRTRTGEGKISYPPYFDEMNNILGEKHKVTPQLVIDTASVKSTGEASTFQSGYDSDSCSSRSTQHSTSATDDSGYTTPTSKVTSRTNRFDSIKSSVRPQKQSVVSSIEEMHRENMEIRKTEFKAMIEVMREENKQRHEQMMALISNMKPKEKKRKRDNSDSD